MIYLLVVLLSLGIGSCKVYLTEGDKVARIAYSDLPDKVQASYYNVYKDAEDGIIDIMPKIINLDSTKVNFFYIENTSVEIIWAGNEIFEIDGKRFYLPWNLNKEIRPYLLYNQIFYCIVGNRESWNNHSINQLKRNEFLEINLTEYLDY
jgi:hypothetical protein